MTWWQRLWRRTKMEEQLEKELRFHLDQHASELIARGHSPNQARRQARLALGGPEQVKENCRDARGTRWLEDLLQDFRYAIRTLRKQPGFAAVALLTLALGSDATTVMFTVINGVLLKPLPYPEPNRLVTVHGHTDTWNTEAFGEQNLAYFDFLDCQRENRSLTMAGWLYSSGGTVNELGEAEYVDRREISSELFSVLGVTLWRGRAFLPEEDRPGAAPVIILSYSFWQRRFAGNPVAIGRSIAFEGMRYTVERATPRVAQRPTLPVSPRSRKTIPTPCGPSPKAAVIWPHCPFLGLVLLHAKSGVYPHSCSHVHANVMISDSLEPHAARLTFAILQPRLDPPPILNGRTIYGLNHNFLSPSLVSNWYQTGLPTSIWDSFLPTSLQALYRSLFHTPSLPFPVLPYYHFLGTSYFFQVRFHYGLVVALGLHSSRMERSASPERWFTLGDPARSDDEKTPNRNSPQAAAFKYGAPRQPPLQDYAAHAHPSF